MISEPTKGLYLFPWKFFVLSITHIHSFLMDRIYKVYYKRSALVRYWVNQMNIEQSHMQLSDYLLIIQQWQGSLFTGFGKLWPGHKLDGGRCWERCCQKVSKIILKNFLSLIPKVLAVWCTIDKLKTWYSLDLYLFLLHCPVYYLSIVYHS